MYKHIIIKSFLFILFAGSQTIAWAQSDPQVNYVISISKPAVNTYHVELKTGGWNQDTLVLKMPKWTPGYYQIMDYAKSVKNIAIKNADVQSLSFLRSQTNTLRIPVKEVRYITVNYDVVTFKQFVANSYVDTKHAYLIPANTFFYVKGFLDIPVHVTIKNNPWDDVATGLISVSREPGKFKASDFDFLYDCPILMGDLAELPSFKINGVVHRFIGYKLGKVNGKAFMSELKQVVKAAIAIIGDIPYDHYTFIDIGPGKGGIEHLNNTTVSMGIYEDSLTSNRTMNYLAHEYFHNYNVKRIRPFELGPFNYEKPSRTYLLWISEGLTVYYEYLIVRRAGLAGEQTLFDDLEENINTYEHNPGKFYQSLVEASYNTWEEGPFGDIGEEPGKTISYYQKGPIIGMFLDFAIRHATHNRKSLDNVMQLLYRKYYKKKERGFTGAEFREACEHVAKTSLAQIFKYVYSTKKLDYNKYLGYAGLKLDTVSYKNDENEQVEKYQIIRIEDPNRLQQAILQTWQGK